MRNILSLIVMTAFVAAAGTALANPPDLPPVPNSLTFYDDGQVLGTFGPNDFYNVDSCAAGDSCEVYRVAAPSCNWWLDDVDSMEGSVMTWFQADVNYAFISENGYGFSHTQNDTSDGITHTISEPNVNLNYIPYTGAGQYNYVMEWQLENRSTGSIHWIAFVIVGAVC